MRDRKSCCCNRLGLVARQTTGSLDSRGIVEEEGAADAGHEGRTAVAKYVGLVSPQGYFDFEGHDAHGVSPAHCMDPQCGEQTRAFQRAKIADCEKHSRHSYVLISC